jgi:ferredoxin-NADP reductase
VVKVLVAKPPEFAFEGGQFVQLGRLSDGLSRPYSIASLPNDDYLEFHVAVYPDGALSPWLATATGEAVTVTGPFGECTYVADEPERPLLLAGTGTGLAPLVAVLRSAVVAAHRGPIVLYHGARTERDLYYWHQLEALELPPRVSLRGVCLEAVPSSTRAVVSGDLVQTLLAAHPKPEPSRIYLCGNPTLVQTLKKRLYLAGASLSRIHSDPFLPRATPT